MTALREETLMYVRHEEKARWLAVGWEETPPLPGSHSLYSACLIWSRDGECVVPEREGQQWTSQQPQQTSTERQP